LTPFTGTVQLKGPGMLAAFNRASLQPEARKGLKMHINAILDRADLQAVIARFETFFEKRGPRDCWEWTSSFAYNGYGLFAIKHKSYRAHRLSYIFYKGALPPDRAVVVRHRCDNPKCVNPKHLTYGSHWQNTQDRKRHGAPWGVCEDNVGAHLTNEQVRAIRLDTRHAKVLGTEYGVTRTAIDNIRKGRNWKALRAPFATLPKYPSGLRGEENVRSKLTVEQVRAIRADLREYPIIAAAYGVNRDSIGHIKRRVTWKHVA
jgi:hypothetical protein